MDKIDQHIQQIYHERLGAKELPPQPDTWGQLGKKMQKKKFFMFSPKRLNIWYLGLMASFVGLLAVLYFHEIPGQNDMVRHQTNTPASYVPDTITKDTMGKTLQQNNQYPEIQQTKEVKKEKTPQPQPQPQPNSTLNNTPQVVEHKIITKDSADIAPQNNSLVFADENLDIEPEIDSSRAKAPLNDTLKKNAIQPDVQTVIKKKKKDTIIEVVDTVKVNKKKKNKVIRLR